MGQTFRPLVSQCSPDVAFAWSFSDFINLSNVPKSWMEPVPYHRAGLLHPVWSCSLLSTCNAFLLFPYPCCQFLQSRNFAIHSCYIVGYIRQNVNIYLEKAMALHSSTLAWKIPWMQEPGRLPSMGSRRVGHDWATSLSLFTFMHWRRKCNPLQHSCLENPRDG